MAVPAAQNAESLSKQFVTRINRKFTDPSGFMPFFTLLIAILMYRVLFLSAFKQRPDIYPRRLEALNYHNHSTETSGSWKNYTYTNGSDEIFPDTTQIGYLITYVLKDEKLICDFNIWELCEIVKSIIVFYFSIKISSPSTWIPSTVSTNAEFYMHLMIINATKSVLTLTFLGGIYFQSAKSWEPFQQIIPGLVYNEILIFSLINTFTIWRINFFTIIRDSQSIGVIIKNTFRFYVARRHLLFFRCFILTVMVLMVGYVTINYKDWYFIGASFLPLLALHIYGEMVMITATASHDWNQNGLLLPFSTLLYSMATVSSKHLGSILVDTLLKIQYNFKNIFLDGVLNLLFIINFLDDILKSDTDDSNYAVTYSKDYAMELSRMFTAVLGQDLLQTKKSVTYFRKIGRPPLHSENESTLACILLLKWSATWTFICWVLYIGNAESLIMNMLILLAYFAIAGTIYYIITTIKTVENTVDFCRIELHEDDLNIIQEEQEEIEENE